MANKKKPRVLIALTGQRLIFSRTAFCLINAAVNAKDYDFDFQMEMGCEIASSRNRLAQAAVDRGCSHILFVDYDMYFGPDVISKMIAYDKDIVAAAYNFRTEVVKSTAVPIEEPAPINELFKCEAVGAGFLLIKTSVLDALPKPWFMWGYNPDGTLQYGEDTYFAQMAKNKAGLDVWADPTLQVKHIGEQLF